MQTVRIWIKSVYSSTGASYFISLRNSTTKSYHCDWITYLPFPLYIQQIKIFIICNKIYSSVPTFRLKTFNKIMNISPSMVSTLCSNTFFPGIMNTPADWEIVNPSVYESTLVFFWMIYFYRFFEFIFSRTNAAWVQNSCSLTNLLELSIIP